MSNVASASINSFGLSPKAEFVSPSEEQIFVLTGPQLQEIIIKAIQPLCVCCQNESHAFDSRDNFQ
jgi:hypothetical protein